MPPFPSLKGLQAFEAAARRGSFAAAATELSVSPAAVSQLIRALEDQVNRKLFHRTKRRVHLTEAGLEILPRVTAAFEDLKAVSQQLAGVLPRARLTVSLPPSAATGWLSTRIAGFIGAQGPVDLALRGEEDPVAFERDMIDIRMTYGRHHYRAQDSEEIVTDAVYPVCAPAFLAEHGPFDRVAALLEAPLIHTDWGPSAASFPTWRSWFEAAGIPPQRQAERGLVANSSKVAMDLAISGLGLALSQGIFAARPMAEGRLVRPSGQALGLAQAYCLTIPQRSANKPVVAAFKAWLIEEIKAAVEAPCLVGPC